MATSALKPRVPAPRRRAAFLPLVLAAGFALTACEEEPRATVTNIVDGDTIDVEYEGEEQRIRLLNIDAPESTAPDVDPDCLGPDASAFLEGLLPLGSEVRLAFDEELQDRYGRVLAGVFRDETLVNAEIARAGLGVARLVEPNARFHEEVLAAQREAEAAGRGLFDPDVECTVPAQVAEFEALVSEALQGSSAQSALAAGATVQEMETYATEVAAAVVTGATLIKLLERELGVYPLVGLSDTGLRTARRETRRSLEELRSVAAQVAEVIEAEERRLEEERREEERRAAEERARRAAEEAAQQAEEEARRGEAEWNPEPAPAGPAPDHRPAPQPTPQEPSPHPTPAPAPPNQRGSPDGYTGCRAYGGLPPNAVDSQGRPYTRIDCDTGRPLG